MRITLICLSRRALKTQDTLRYGLEGCVRDTYQRGPERVSQ
jgi:hypothetical protein